MMTGGCAAAAPYRSQTYVVGPQDTLYSIAWRHDLDYRELARWNNLGSDYKVSIGQVLVLTGAGARAAGASRPAPMGPPSPVAAERPRVASQVPQVPQVPQAPQVPGAALLTRPTVGGNLKWVWPTERSSAPVQVPGGGVLLLGRLGQDVRAAGAGRVVYAGSGLRGYGNLVIIKHGDALLSSYAHNREVVVHEGQDVAAGQIIAHMGTGAHRISALYFEIRVNGKPADPLRYLTAAK